MKTLPLSEAKIKLSRLVAKVVKTDDEVMITRNGRPAAVLISPDQYEGWRETMDIMRDGEFYRDIKKGMEDFKKGRTKALSLDEVFGPKS